MKRYSWLCLIILLFGWLVPGGSLLADGEGQLKLGYIYADEEGNLGVNQETYNLYEGASVSLEGFRYFTGDGVNITADLQNITLNNRNLRTSVSKPGLFGLSLFNHQYRRQYNFDGGKFTRRRSTGGQVDFSPNKYFNIFGGYSRTDKHGENFNIISPIQDTVIAATNYTHAALNIGAEAMHKQSRVRFEYRRMDFTDDAHADSDRSADNFIVSGFMPVPGREWITLAGGYRYRNDQHSGSGVELTTNQGWAATRVYLPHKIVADYRFTIARSDHSERAAEVDNYVNTISFGRSWRQGVGLRLGYENRISDDILNRTTSHALQASGWLRYQKSFTVRGHVVLRQKEVSEGHTLLGDEDYSRFDITARYYGMSWLDVTGKYLSRVKTNDDIGTKVDYDGLTWQFNFKNSSYGKLTVSYAYYRGRFENHSLGDPQEYEFSDHTITGMVYPMEYHGLQLSFGGTYYRSYRDQDTEKFNIRIGALYKLPGDYEMEIAYRAYNHDDFHVNDRYYTGNVVDLNLIKNFKI